MHARNFNYNYIDSSNSMSNHGGKWVFYDYHIYICIYIYIYIIYYIYYNICIYYIIYIIYYIYYIYYVYILYIYIYQKSNILISIILSIIPSPLFTFVSQCWRRWGHTSQIVKLGRLILIRNIFMKKSM